MDEHLKNEAIAACNGVALHPLLDLCSFIMHQSSETPTAGSVPSTHMKDPEKGLSKTLSRTNTAASVTEGTVSNEGYGEYKAVFQTGATQVISLGSNMGSGLFVATGKALFIGMHTPLQLRGAC